MKSKIAFLVFSIVSVTATLWIFRALKAPDTIAVTAKQPTTATTTEADRLNLSVPDHNAEVSSIASVTDSTPDTTTDTTPITTRIDSVTEGSHSLGAVWVFGTGPSALNVSGAGTTFSGPVHSEGNIRIRGAGTNFRAGEVSYVAALDVAGASVSLQGRTVKVSAGRSIRRYVPSEFGPESAVARGSTNYRSVDSSRCSEGTWIVSARELRNNTLYYSTCNIRVSGAGATRSATLVSEGSITISGAGLSFDAGSPGLPALIAETVAFNGAAITVRAPIVSEGTVLVSGSSLKLCGVVGSDVTVGGANTRISVCGR